MHVSVCVSGGAGNPGSLQYSPQFNAMHLSPTLSNQSGACDSDQGLRVRCHSGRPGHTHAIRNIHTLKHLLFVLAPDAHNVVLKMQFLIWFKKNANVDIVFVRTDIIITQATS